MTVLDIDVKELKPYENNPRQNAAAVASVAESINQFGFRQPIVIDASNVVVCGHTRLKAAKKLRLKKVPCVRADDLTDEQIKAYRLLDNKLAEKSSWDFDALEIELEALDFDFDAFDVSFDRDADDEAEDADDKKQTVFDSKTECADVFGVYCEFDTESEQANFYEELQSRGITCRITNV